LLCMREARFRFHVLTFLTFQRYLVPPSIRRA
jgi:hypothetical protein